MKKRDGKEKRGGGRREEGREEGKGRGEGKRIGSSGKGGANTRGRRVVVGVENGLLGAIISQGNGAHYVTGKSSGLFNLTSGSGGHSSSGQTNSGGAQKHHTKSSHYVKSLSQIRILNFSERGFLKCVVKNTHTPPSRV